MTDFYSPLRYPGGKAKVSDFIKEIFKKNLLMDGWYIEPYAGGASVALTLLIDEYASNIVINDYDKSIYAFWHSVLNDTESLCKKIKDTVVNIETWKLQKEIQKEKNIANIDDLGFSTFFLNRTNRSGIIKGGVIGGIDQIGNYKIDARYNKDNLIKRIQRIAKYSDRINLYNLDACNLIPQLKKTLPINSLFYFDPPYYLKGKELYVNYYKHSDHEEVSKMITSLDRHKWIVSYDNALEIKQLYSKHQTFEYSLNYSAAKSSKGTEVFIYSDNIFLPETIDLTDVKIIL
ncbi:DNA adenine methylase [Mucilaginibacter sp. UR6-1]|uniref:DNA adenine methylase n=1 Tax=Mucilaginibacter sp. UR6-1 TaxID=1435643 RepID=UPI001E51366D|nr:DNA adenine methylase [Mucilaginibacter sp. UR6-1]MCC8408350.1 DNA adenine methylase [Mucilaginibacter sp. UR6-1]